MLEKKKRPGWIRGRVPAGSSISRTADSLKKFGLKTVCAEAACPNKGECWDRDHATFMILGNICTRACKFCNVASGYPLPPDDDEPLRVAGAVKEIGIKYAVITSVTRDDLGDKGAGQFKRTVEAIRDACPGAIVEVLIPDLGGEKRLIEAVALSGARVIGHNIELPRGLYPEVRPEADYQRSLDVLRVLSGHREKGAGILVKSSIILGLGEDEGDIDGVLRDLRFAGVDIVYIGQYLSPSREHYPVARFYGPGEFASLEDKARGMGFSSVLSGPMVRSSYRAYDLYLESAP